MIDVATMMNRVLFSAMSRRAASGMSVLRELEPSTETIAAGGPQAAGRREGVGSTVQVSPSLTQLEDKISDLGKIVELAISRSISSLLRQDTFLARAVIQEDRDIDRLEVEIQETCIQILEQERPSGKDLRFVVAALKVNESLERIGDLAENVAESVVEVANWERFRRVDGIAQLTDAAQMMVKRSLEAWVRRDAGAARDVISSDDRVDALHAAITRRIELEIDRIPENANPLMKLELMCRQFERMADVATNIAEETVYLVEGQIVRHRS